MSSLKEKLQKEPFVPSLPHVDDHAKEFERGVYTVTDGVYVAIGYALANSICVETKNGLVIIDVMEDVDAARSVCREFKRLTGNKPIKSVIFTHAHFDHVAGIRGFIENECDSPTIYLHEECLGHEQRNVVFKYGIGARSLRQFGNLLSHQVPSARDKNWFKNAGIGAALNVAPVLDEDGNIVRQFEHSVADTKLFQTFGDQHSFIQDGITFEMVAAFGETDDHCLIYVPEKSLLLPGDNIYRSFPNLYAIRGAEPRCAYSWYKSVEKMIDYAQRYQIKHLVPSHSRHIVGRDQVLETLTVYRDGIAFVHDQTIRFLNQGYSQEQIVAEIRKNKPVELFQRPHLLEFYGTIEWGVKAIFMKNMGWFSGHVDDLYPCSKQMRSAGMIEFAAFMRKHAEIEDDSRRILRYLQFMNEAKKTNRLTQYTRDDANRWLLELTTLLKLKLQNCVELKELRYEVIRDMASYQTSGPARNYFLTYWLEEKYDLELKGSGNFSDLIQGRPLKWAIMTLPFHVDPDRCRNVISAKQAMITGIIELYDVAQCFKLQLKRIGVMQLTQLRAGEDYDMNDQRIDWILKLNEQQVKSMLANPSAMSANGGNQSPIEQGHMIPRVRTGSGLFIAILNAMIASNNATDAKKKGSKLMKGKQKAIEFFSCLETKVISRL